MFKVNVLSKVNVNSTLLTHALNQIPDAIALLLYYTQKDDTTHLTPHTLTFTLIPVPAQAPAPAPARPQTGRG